MNAPRFWLRGSSGTPLARPSRSSFIWFDFSTKSCRRTSRRVRLQPSGQGPCLVRGSQRKAQPVFGWASFGLALRPSLGGLVSLLPSYYYCRVVSRAVGRETLFVRKTDVRMRAPPVAARQSYPPRDRAIQ